MITRLIRENEKNLYNSVVSHVIQSWEWGDFRKLNGLELVRIGHFEGEKLLAAYQLTFHPIPFFKQVIGYMPKGPMVDQHMKKALFDLAKEKNAAFIKIEPNVEVTDGKQKVIRDKIVSLGFVESKKSLFTKYNFVVDLTKTEEELLSLMHPKTRYNIGVAKKKGVEVYASDSDRDFEIYLKLYFETTKRQKYFGHTHEYHRQAWRTLKKAKMCRVLIAKYSGKPLVAWMLFNFGDTLYYPYGGSSDLHREVMASNLVAWEAIRLGKNMKLKVFDMWGALGPDANESDPWYGFHRFKAGYGPRRVEYAGTYDFVAKPSLYSVLNTADKLRWGLLRATRR